MRFRGFKALREFRGETQGGSGEEYGGGARWQAEEQEEEEDEEHEKKQTEPSPRGEE